MKAAELINEFHSEFKEFKGLALVLKYILSEINLLNPFSVKLISFYIDREVSALTI